jgi:hypothetical protein
VSSTRTGVIATKPDSSDVVLVDSAVEALAGAADVAAMRTAEIPSTANRNETLKVCPRKSINFSFRDIHTVLDISLNAGK